MRLDELPQEEEKEPEEEEEEATEDDEDLSTACSLLEDAINLLGDIDVVFDKLHVFRFLKKRCEDMTFDIAKFLVESGYNEKDDDINEDTDKKIITIDPQDVREILGDE